MRAVSFLVSRQSKEGTWNYWNPSADEHASEPYPDDLDDTASALSAIALFNQDLLSGTDFSRFVKALCEQEAAPGGPYRTWCLNGGKNTAQNEIDIGVNAAIGFALSIHAVELRGLSSYIEKVIEEDRLTSRYYFDEITLIYLIARWYSGSCTKTLIKKLYDKLEHAPIRENCLAMSMILSSLCRLGEPKSSIQGHAEALAREITRGPRAYGLYIEKVEGDRRRYSGSGALTAALCAEALSLMIIDQREPDDYEEDLYQKIWADTAKTLNGERILGDEQIEEFIEYALGRENKKKIALLPFHCCMTENIKSSAEDIFARAGTAHLLGVIAYGVFDKIADRQEESIDPIYASLGLIAHAECISILNSLSAHDAFVSGTLRNMGYTAIWESEKASFSIAGGVEISCIPDFSSRKALEKKSGGISLAAISTVNRISSDSSASRHLKQFFEHYCAARHMHDDTHDWKDDLRCGRVNSTSAECLTLGIQNELLSLPIKSSYEELEMQISRILMSEGISVISEKILSLILRLQKKQ